MGQKLGRGGQGDNAIKNRNGNCLEKCKLRFLHSLPNSKTEGRNCLMPLTDEIIH